MPANLPPDYYAAERRYRTASDIQEKIQILHDMLAIMPKHKGTEHLQGDLKRKIARLNAETQKKKNFTRQTAFDYIQREGAGQAVLVGSPNTGKSTIVHQLTQAHVDVADFPFSTFKPISGMMPYMDIQIQLIDLPPVHDNFTESWIYNIIRISDVVLWTVDLSVDQPTSQMYEVLHLLKNNNIHLVSWGQHRPQGQEARKTTILIGTKCDSVNASERWGECLADCHEPLPQIKLSAETEENMNDFKKLLFNMLNIIRVYTKIPGKEADMKKPYILPRGSNVLDLASHIHHDLAEKINYARIWGSEKYEGQRVNREHTLKDGDILEIHMR